MTICRLYFIFSQAGMGTVTEEDRQEAAWAASLCHRLRQTRRQEGVFHWRKRAALLGSLLQTREALQLVRSPGARQRDTQTQRETHTQTIAPESRVYAGDQRRIYSCHLDYFHRYPVGCSSSAVPPTNGDRILELVVSRHRTERVRCWAFCWTLDLFFYLFIIIIYLLCVLPEQEEGRRIVEMCRESF